MSLGAIALLPVVFGFNECQQSTPTPVCDTGCSSGQVVICGDVCATPVALDDECDIDPCDEKSLCEEGLTCVGTQGDGYYCRDLGGILLAECSQAGKSPGADDCANNLYCRDNYDCECPDPNAPGCAEMAAHPFFTVPHCMPPVTQEGAACDSEIDDPKCMPCGPGLDCINGSCLRACAFDEECACGPGGQQLGECESGLCRVCREVGETCDAYQQCCGGSACEGSSPNGFSTCCLPPDQGLSCNTVFDCCPQSGTVVVCAPDTGTGAVKTCQACLTEGLACVSSDQCCGSASCVNGKCTEQCVGGEDCVVPGGIGPCAEGVTVCDGNVVSCQGAFPETESCDGIDNDCNGEADDGIAPDPCNTVTRDQNFNPISCQSGFDAEATQVCNDGTKECVATETICTACVVGDPVCGTCANNPCGPGLLCPPGYRCMGISGSETCQLDAACGPTKLCWKPEDVGGC